MSRASDAKKARRKKRQAALNGPRRTDTPQYAEPDEAGEPDELTEAIAEISRWIGGRGWVLDVENSGDDLVTWVYPPSAAEFDDDVEPVTRVWLALEEDDEQVELVMGAALVGAGAGAGEDGGDDGLYLLDLSALADDVAVLEAYRAGEPWPEL